MRLDSETAVDRLTTVADNFGNEIIRCQPKINGHLEKMTKRFEDGMMNDRDKKSDVPLDEEFLNSPRWRNFVETLVSGEWDIEVEGFASEEVRGGWVRLLRYTKGVLATSESRFAENEIEFIDRKLKQLRALKEKWDKHDEPIVDSLELRVGSSLIPLVKDSEQNDLLEMIPDLRSRLMSESGIEMPIIRIRDSGIYENTEYRLLVFGRVVARAEVLPDEWLAINTGDVADPFCGEIVQEPFEEPSVWITTSDREWAENTGYTVIDPRDVLIQHIENVVRAHADELAKSCRSQFW